MNAKSPIFKKRIGFAILSFALLAGCGGGGGDGSIGINSFGSGVINGTAIKGPVSGATVTVYSMNADGTKGGEFGLASVTPDTILKWIGGGSRCLAGRG